MEGAAGEGGQLGHATKRLCKGCALLRPQMVPVGIGRDNHDPPAVIKGLVVVEVEVEAGEAGEGAEVAQAGAVVGGDDVLMRVAVAFVL